MHCVFMFRDASGRLATAEELLSQGFRVSVASLPPAPDQTEQRPAQPELPAQATRETPGAPDVQRQAEQSAPLFRAGSGLALAAEPTRPYGASRSDGPADAPLGEDDAG